jgi:protein TonB
MNKEWPAFGTSLFLHLLVLAGLFALGSDLVPPHRLEHYEVDLSAFFASPVSPSPVQKPAPVPPVPAKQKSPSPPIATPVPVAKPAVQKVSAAALPPSAEAVLPESASTAIAPPAAAPSLAAPPVDPAASYALQVQRYGDAQLSLIREKVSREVRYPLMARRQGWVGRVTVEFTVQLSGEVGALRVAESSGYPMLDRQALLAVKAASPFSPPPVVATLNLPVAFELH